MRNFKRSSVLAAAAILSGCSSLPDVNVIDDLADIETKTLVENSVWVIAPERARRFDDPAWPAPIQVVPPLRENNPINGKYDVKLFDSSPTGQRIDVIYVSDGDEGVCNRLLSLLGISASESAWVDVNNGGDDVYRCASVLISSPHELMNLVNPFISDYRKVNLSVASKVVTGEKYPIKIQYIHND